jgi:hypothetical protein
MGIAPQRKLGPSPVPQTPRLPLNNRMGPRRLDRRESAILRHHDGAEMVHLRP